MPTASSKTAQALPNVAQNKKNRIMISGIRNIVKLNSGRAINLMLTLL